MTNKSKPGKPNTKGKPPFNPAPAEAAKDGKQGKTSTWGVDITKYKTELCKNWIEVGTCRYGTKCQFAHGKDEQNSSKKHKKYRSKECNNFFE